MAQANVKLTVDATNATRALQGVQNKTNQLQKSFGGLRTAIAGIGIGLLARNTVKTTANFQALQIRMKVLTSEFGEFAQVQNLVTKAQNQFNLSIVEATQGITDIFARLRPLGVSLKDIETTFIGFNSIAKVAGLNATEASAAFTQLAQGLGSGRLQGDEFRSIAEQVPQLLKAISDETGIASGKLKDFASKGLLKSDIIIRALSKSAKGLGKQISEIIDKSPAEKFKALNNELLELQLTIGSKLTPILADGAVKLAAFVDSFTKFVDSDAGQASLIIGGLILAAKGLSVTFAFIIPQLLALQANFATMSIAAAAANGTLGASATAAFAAAGGFTKAALAANAFKVALLKTGVGAAVIALGFFLTKILQSINAQREFNKLLEQGSAKELAEELKEAKDRANELNETLKNVGTNRNASGTAKRLKRELAKANEEIERLKKGIVIKEGIELFRDFEKAKNALKEKNEALKINLQRTKIATEEGKKQFDQEQRRIELTEKYGEELAKIILELEKENQNLEEGAEKIKKKQEETDKLKERMAEVGQVIEDSIKNNLRDAITGAKSFGQAMTNVLNRIRDKIIDSQIDKLLDNFGDSFTSRQNKGGIGGFLGKILGGLFADGGRPPVGKASIVGERGPELFVPKVGGTIIPNNKLGGGTTNIINVSVDASGSSVQGNEGQGQALGQLIAAVVQTTIVQEQRAGGLLNR